MFNRPLPAPARDIALLIGRVVLGIVLFAHGWQKLMINGIAGTYGQFEKMGIPLAIVSASFTSFVEFVGGALLIVGALTTTVVALDLVVMVGAAGFVHITHGIFAQDGGWELVGVIVAAELALAATGPGRYSVDHLISTFRSREEAEQKRVLTPAQRAQEPQNGTFAPAVRAPRHLGGPQEFPAGQQGGSQGTGGYRRAAAFQQSEPMQQAPGQPFRSAEEVQQSGGFQPSQAPRPAAPVTQQAPVAQQARLVEQRAAVEQSPDYVRTRVPGYVPAPSYEQAPAYQRVSGFEPSTANEPAPMFDPARRFDQPQRVDNGRGYQMDASPWIAPTSKAATLDTATVEDAAPRTEQFRQVEPSRPAADLPRQVDAALRETARADVASAPDELRPAGEARPAERVDGSAEPGSALPGDGNVAVRQADPQRQGEPQRGSDLPQRAARSERVRMAATPFQ